MPYEYSGCLYFRSYYKNVFDMPSDCNISQIDAAQFIPQVLHSRSSLSGVRCSVEKDTLGPILPGCRLAVLLFIYALHLVTALR